MSEKTYQTYEHLLDALREVKANYIQGRDEWDALCLFRDALVEIRSEASERINEIHDKSEDVPE